MLVFHDKIESAKQLSRVLDSLLQILLSDAKCFVYHDLYYNAKKWISSW